MAAACRGEPLPHSLRPCYPAWADATLDGVWAGDHIDLGALLVGAWCHGLVGTSPFELAESLRFPRLVDRRAPGFVVPVYHPQPASPGQAVHLA